MANPKLSNKFGRVLGGIDGEGFRDDEEGLREFTNGKLFPRALCLSCQSFA